jgi:tetratricopeptide (TPR) repeat protein
VALDDSLSESHSALATALASQWKWSEAEAEFRRSIQLNPNNSTAHYFYGLMVLNPTNRVNEALHELEVSLSLDPLSPILNCNYGMMLMVAHRYPEAIAQIQKVIDRDPNFAPAHYKLSELYAGIGRLTDATAEMKKAIPLNTPGLEEAATYPEVSLLFTDTLTSRDTYTPNAYAYATFGNRDKAFELLEKAYTSRDGELLLSIRYPGFDSIRSDPRFRDLLHRMGFQE